ncbi:unnamed protein product [Lactuca virosa]|uniref:Ribosomal RNA-processing protein 12-like conserved domain-containing protein n=1 Tax=Lactuca virosa TaxID=75947 RepID=A0AAU9NKY3_9ASTR|nr:unnamed protein product [Lactuca virosa]
MEESTISFTGESDICQQLLHRYSKSIAPQHFHLCAIASAFLSTAQSESRSLTPLDYYYATIDALLDSSKTDNNDADDVVSALSSFLALVLPLVPKKSIDMSTAARAVEIVVNLLDNSCQGLQVSRVRALLKCLGLLLELCNSADSKFVQLGFQTLIKHAIDKRPKVRKCAQDRVVKVFKSFQSPVVKNSASKLVLKSFKTCMSSAIKTVGSRSADGSKDDLVSKCKHLEVLRMFDLLKILLPCLPSEVISKAIVELQKSLSTKFSLLAMHALDFMEEILRFFESESEPEPEPEPELTMSDKVKIVKKWNCHYSLVIGSIAGLLKTSEATAIRASNILKEMINRVDLYEHVDTDGSKESRIVKSLCDALLEVLSTQKGTPNEHSLAVISDLFRELWEYSHTYMGNILLKLASFMTTASGDVKHLQECIGSAIIVMGPVKALALLPISHDADDLTFSNTWLIPILKEYTCRSYLEFFIQSIVPLAESFREASQKVKRSEIREELQSHARGCWGLLLAFCRQPIDMHETFGSLAKLLISYIEKDAYMLEDIAIALQHLVNDNKNWSSLDDDQTSKLPRIDYDKKIATRNIKALSSCSEELLMAFTQVFFQVSPMKRAFVKDTIGCLALVTEYSTIKVIFISSLKLNVSVEKIRVDANMCLLLELASSFVGATSIDPTDLIYDFIKDCLQEENDNLQSEAYATLYKILEECFEFKSSKFEQLMDLLLDLKSPVDIISLRRRFSCFKILLVHSIEITRDGENTYGVHMLNEIIVTIADSKEESRKVAHDVLRKTSSILKKTSLSKRKRAPYYEFITMIMGYISGSSPCIKSGAVSALSVLISNDSEICHLMPDLVSEILELLDSEDIQVTKAVLGFLKMLVLSLQARDLQKFLSDILEELLPWSSISQHHIKSEVTLIFEIMMRKCGSALVKSLVPEKYRDFVDNDRKGKTSFPEDVMS